MDVDDVDQNLDPGSLFVTLEPLPEKRIFYVSREAKSDDEIKEFKYNEFYEEPKTEESKFIQLIQQIYNQKIEDEHVDINYKGSEEINKTFHQLLAELELLIAWKDKPCFSVHPVIKPPLPPEVVSENQMANFAEAKKHFEKAYKHFESCIPHLKDRINAEKRYTTQLLNLRSSKWHLVPKSYPINENELSRGTRIDVEFSAKKSLPLINTTTGDIEFDIKSRIMLNLQVKIHDESGCHFIPIQDKMFLSGYMYECLDRSGIEKNKDNWKSIGLEQTHFLLNVLHKCYLNALSWEIIQESFILLESDCNDSNHLESRKTSNSQNHLKINSQIKNTKIVFNNQSLRFELPNFVNIFTIELKKSFDDNSAIWNALDFQKNFKETSSDISPSKSSKNGWNDFNRDSFALKMLIINSLLKIQIKKAVHNIHKQLKNKESSFPYPVKRTASETSQSKIKLAFWKKLDENEKREPAHQILTTTFHLKNLFGLMPVLDNFVLLINRKCHLGTTKLHWDTTSTPLVSSVSFSLMDFSFHLTIENGIFVVDSETNFTDTATLIQHLSFKLINQIINKACSHIKAILGDEVSLIKGSNYVEFPLGIHHPILNKNTSRLIGKARFQLCFHPQIFILPKLFIATVGNIKEMQTNVNLNSQKSLLFEKVSNSQKNMNYWKSLKGNNYIDKITGLILESQSLSI